MLLCCCAGAPGSAAATREFREVPASAGVLTPTPAQRREQRKPFDLEGVGGRSPPRARAKGKPASGAAGKSFVRSVSVPVCERLCVLYRLRVEDLGIYTDESSVGWICAESCMAGSRATGSPPPGCFYR